METHPHPTGPRRGFRAASRLTMLTAAFLAVVHLLPATINLPIRNRMQWVENDGYCGETSLQEVGLYYGLYVSQHYVRGIFDPTQTIDLAEQENWLKVCAKLRLKCKFFVDLEAPIPQFRPFSGWVKRELRKGHPVILAAWLASDDGASTSNPPFPDTVDPDPLAQIDHFVTAAGYVGNDDDKYHGDDLLFITNHHYSTYTWAQRFGLLFDTRENVGNARMYVVTLPKDYCVGISITGTTGTAGNALPVHLELDRIDEPDLIAAQTPVDLRATVTVTGLSPGKTYALYRYNDPEAIPADGVDDARPSDKKVVFKADGATHKISDGIRSDGFAAYRCVPVGK